MENQKAQLADELSNTKRKVEFTDITTPVLEIVCNELQKLLNKSQTSKDLKWAEKMLRIQEERILKKIGDHNDPVHTDFMYRRLSQADYLRMKLEDQYEDVKRCKARHKQESDKLDLLQRYIEKAERSQGHRANFAIDQSCAGPNLYAEHKIRKLMNALVLYDTDGCCEELDENCQVMHATLLEKIEEMFVDSNTLTDFNDSWQKFLEKDRPSNSNKSSNEKIWLTNVLKSIHSLTIIKEKTKFSPIQTQFVDALLQLLKNAPYISLINHLIEHDDAKEKVARQGGGEQARMMLSIDRTTEEMIEIINDFFLLVDNNWQQTFEWYRNKFGPDDWNLKLQKCIDSLVEVQTKLAPEERVQRIIQMFEEEQTNLGTD